MMDERSIVVGGVVVAVCANAVLGAVTETATLLAVTPVGVLVYLVVGVGLPQLVVYRRTASTGALGTSVLVGVLSGAVLVAGLLGGGLWSDWGGWFAALLLLALLGVLLGVSGRAFADGYRS
ncbi:hypothetical protein [Halorubellus sp. PRR65]|uniref:hypothetical protein n=1 Tax=Halorubellus sp. PRR65 TaxID=3098148 RepID=UPI002B261C39|nr:hypothetical protein [Halorubellus sp. PRR65]